MRYILQEEFFAMYFLFSDVTFVYIYIYIYVTFVGTSCRIYIYIYILTFHFWHLKHGWQLLIPTFLYVIICVESTHA